MSSAPDRRLTALCRLRRRQWVSLVIGLICVLTFPFLDLPAVVQVAFAVMLVGGYYVIAGQAQDQSTETPRDTFLLIASAIALGLVLTALLLWGAL